MKEPPVMRLEPFIIDWLDDLPMRILSFRLLCRIHRRGECYESKPNLEREFKVSNDTLARAFKELLKAGWITEEIREATTNVYRSTLNKMLYVLARLDDSGLGMRAFRLLFHLHRRGECWDGKKDLARRFKVSRRSIVDAFGELMEAGWITGEIRNGDSTIYRPRVSIPDHPVPDGTPPHANGHSHPMPDSTSPHANGHPHPVPDGTPTPCRTALPPHAIRHPEGNPSKGIQRRNSNEGVLLHDFDKSANEPSVGSSIFSLSEAEEIYQVYPRKTGRDKAIKAIEKALKKHSFDFLFLQVTAYAEAIQWQEKRFIPYPANWFNAGHYDDDPSEWEMPEDFIVTDGSQIGGKAVFTGTHAGNYEEFEASATR